MVLSCVLPIETGETTFSLAIRTCRTSDIGLSDLLGTSFNYDLAGFRDFPMVVSSLESCTGTRFFRRTELFSEHSAALYYMATIPDPFRSDELERSLRKTSFLLRPSVGSTWSHLRFCEQCAREEYKACRYSWWHRDHQLPLESICAIHSYPLTTLRLVELGMHLPHELGMAFGKNQRRAGKPHEIELLINRFERFLATGKRTPVLKSLLQQTESELEIASSDSVEQGEIACASAKNLLKILLEHGVREPMEDWDRLSLAMKKLLRDGIDFADPVALILLIVAVNHSHRPRLDFSA